MYGTSTLGGTLLSEPMYPYFCVGPIKTKPLGPNSFFSWARIGASARQSLHQCAQKNKRVGLPLGRETPSKAGAGLPSKLIRLMFLLMRACIEVFAYFCSSDSNIDTASVRWPREAMTWPWTSSDAPNASGS